MKPLAYCISLVAVGLLLGCVERELTITSQPEDALVYVSDEEVGRTPVTIPFTWYGDYDIILRKDGYETLDTHAEIDMPWYEVPPIDLLSAVAPWTYHDRRYLHYELEPLTLPGDEELLDEAEQMRQRTIEPVK
ncbi:MAG: PEGA domain-containing protein [Phycisphaerae bacterium]